MTESERSASPSPTHAIPQPPSPIPNPQHDEPQPSSRGPEPDEPVNHRVPYHGQPADGLAQHEQAPEGPAEQLGDEPGATPQELASTNGLHDAREPPSLDDGPPAKRRRVRDTTPNNSVRKPKIESPPWKKIEAEGPSTFTAEDGRRKSGRINTVPLELQPAGKRITRRVLHSQQPATPKTRQPATNGHGTPASAPAKRAVASGKPATPKQPPPPKASPRKPAAQEPKPTAARGRRRSASPRRLATPVKQTLGTRRSTRRLRDPDEDGDDADHGLTRSGTHIKLRARPPLTTIPLVHRDQANLRPTLGPTFEEYFERAVHIPVEEGGLFASSEDGPRYTAEAAAEDARLILRVEQEVEPGGLLAGGRCSVFEPEPVEEPRQWAHMDHLTKAMANFRKLMLLEQQRHRGVAKRLAIACEVEWRRRNPQPKTAEEIEREEIEQSKARWRQVNKVLAGTWENVKAEINRRRLADWEAEEQRRVKAALNQAVNLSEQKLQARQVRLDTEDLSDDDSDDDNMLSDRDDEDALDGDTEPPEGGSEEEDGDDEDNMSSSGDEEDKDSVLSDEGLTQEQLREKYANLPALDDPSEGKPDPATATPADDASTPALDGDDTSDESIDMDDDLGSTEDESAGDDDEGSDGDSESDEEPAGLLGLLFGKSELKKLKAEAAAEDSGTHQDDTELADAGASVRLKASVNGTATTNEDQQTSPKAPAALGERTEQVSTTDVTLPASPPVPPAQVPQPIAEPAGPESESHALQPPMTNGVPAQPVLHGESGWAAGPKEEPAEDVSMVDAPACAEAEMLPVPTVQHPSPETEPTTNAHSPSRSQSPRASDDTKPTDAETSRSVSLLNAPKSESRSTSPQPAAPRTEIPFLLRGTLREYQHLGLDWLAALYANNTNGILADEMGLGKTIQTIALLAHLACYHEVWGPHLVIVPTSVMLNWEMEFKKWCPGFKILTYYGNQEERKRKRLGWTNDDVWNVCITSYQMVLQDAQVFRRRRWHYMVLDEAHNIKNFKSQRWQTLLGFNTHSRLLLTGTPLQNNLTELWSLLYFLAPPENGEGGFVDLKEFHNWFSRPESQILESGREQLDDEARAIISKLHKVLRPYLLRRLKADVEKQMPAKYEHVEFCRLSKRQRELYDGFLSRADTRETLSSGNYMSIINCLMQLRKVCNHPDLFVDRPIMTSFRMQRSVATDFEGNEQIVRKKLLAVKPMEVVSLNFLNMIATQYEGMPTGDADRISQLSTHRILLDLREAQKTRANNAHHPLDPASVKSNLVYLESAARWGRFEELQHGVYLNALRRQQRPIYGKRLLEFLTLDTHIRPYKQRPRLPQKMMSWFEEDSFLLRNAIPTLQQRAESMETTITKFACVTPAVVTGDLGKLLLGAKGTEAFEEADLRLSAPVKYAPYMPKERPADPWHEARMRLSIQFPDKRLLQYDCGKLQALDKLLRRLQAGGHRALIFTQMTKVLNILEQFLNIHGHKYLRLDGATKVEQRQILTDRFNHDPRILCFILSTRSGGLGINLTGADTVIFYDQDWNPAMDKQCQDRCHRIGQTRDVHIYRLVSEHTIEANILRKAGQKQMLDDVVIQEGEFTTDYFNKLSVRDVIGTNGEVMVNEDDVAANAAMDRVLGGVESSSNPRSVGRVLEQAEDKEDVAAARVAEKEIQQDDADFLEQQPTSGSAGQGTPREGTTEPMSAVGRSGLGLFAESAEDGLAVEPGAEAAEVEINAFGERVCSVDDYMLRFMVKALEGTPLELPRDRKKSKKKGKDTRKR
ncbi:SNF2 family N-terminal domain-containing protein [Staphylotrichum tortipilum]|uniref:DNA helicase n=1 Tax=Staphylotrichum tortipilum TaxID=2831512 RepID=A0AAN6MNE9_9PEZI|nr:SNF2 family N-terminal domain-containing protein [Staphylotrichum longicolle]